MSSSATATVTEMLETLPEQLQERVLEHLRDYIEDLREESQWSEAFSKNKEKLISAARQARQAVTEGSSKPLDIEKL